MTSKSPASNTGSGPKSPTTSPGVIRAAKAFREASEISRTPAIGAIVAGYRRARSLPSANLECIVVNADQGGRSSNLGSSATHQAQFATVTDAPSTISRLFFEATSRGRYFRPQSGCMAIFAVRRQAFKQDSKGMKCRKIVIFFSKMIPRESVLTIDIRNERAVIQ